MPFLALARGDHILTDGEAALVALPLLGLAGYLAYRAVHLARRPPPPPARRIPGRRNAPESVASNAALAWFLLIWAILLASKWAGWTSVHDHARPLLFLTFGIPVAVVIFAGLRSGH